jgi:hypothetical protein
MVSDERSCEDQVSLMARTDSDERAIRLGRLALDDPALARAALLVPIDLQALVVTATESVTAAAVGVGMDDPTRPPPFTEGPTRAPGVHLHWAMPDGLGRGTDAGTRVQFPALPDHWLVARFDGAPGSETRGLRLWLLDAAQGLVIAPDEVTPDIARSTAEQRRRLTVTGDADPAWAAVYDNAVDRFALYDDLADVAAEARLSYLAVGWYSDADLDPIATASTVGDALDTFGWSVAGRSTEAREVARLICHGTVVGVRPTGPARDEDARPDAPATALAIGATDADALAWLLAADVAPTGTVDDLERLALVLTALGLGRLDDLDDPEGLGRLEEAVHAVGFETIAGAPIEETIVHQPPPLELSRPPLPRDGLLRRDQIDPRIGREQPTTEERQERRGFDTGPWWPPDETTPQGDEAAVAEALVVRLAELGMTEDQTTLARIARGFAWLGITPDLVAALPQRRLAALMDWAHDAIARVDASSVPPTTEIVRHPARPWYVPRDPAVVLRGVGRSLRHGDDGRFDRERGRLLCRMSDQVVTGFDGLVDGTQAVPLDMVADPGGRGRSGVLAFGTPPAAFALIRETALLDPYGLDAVVAASGRSETRDRLAGEQALAALHDRWERDLGPLDDRSTRRGVLPSPVAWQTWMQPWVPLYLEWEMQAALDRDLDHWQLAELDLDRRADAPGYTGTVLHAGRSLLDPAPGRRVAAQAAYQLARAGQVGSVDATAEDLRRLGRLASDAGYADLLVGGLDGIIAWQLGFRSNVAAVDPATGQRRFRREAAPDLLRGGQLWLTRLRVVDAFGRTLDLTERIPAAAVSVAVTTTPALADAEPGALPAVRSGGIALPARVVRPARLTLDLCDRSWATIPSHRGPTPAATVTGWLLPDRVDDAVEVFSAEGNPLGQLRQDPVAGAVLWEPPPGMLADLGTGPAGSQVDPDLGAFLHAVVTADVHDRSVGARRSHSPLQALLRVIDLTLWTTAPLSERTAPTVSALAGAPMAVVRTRLELGTTAWTMEIGATTEDPDGLLAAEARLAATAIEARLGALTRQADSVVGYALRSSPTEFRVVHPAVLRAAGLDREEGEESQFDQPFVSAAPLLLRPNQPLDLLLFLDPAGAITVTSGVVPRFASRVPQEWAAATPALRPSFRFGPLLLDGYAATLPVITAEGSAPTWVRRDAPDHWVVDPVVPTSLAGRLPLDTVIVQDGWAGLRPADPQSNDA